jgi:putative nucleotidyltransferase with HDIG domain
MEQKTLEYYKKWFTDYVAAFYGNDEFVNAHIKLKEEHTKIVCLECNYIADSMLLDANKKRLAETMALFHDVGRFEQFTKYRTYKDDKSINHCELGVKILREKKLLEPLEKNERELIEKVVGFHGVRQLNLQCNSDCLFYLKIIRDADKVDVLRVMIMYFSEYKANPDEFRFEAELADIPEYSEGVLKAILLGETLDYRSLRTFNDLKLLLLGWMYDINFPATFKRIKERRLLEQLIDFMPVSKETREVKKKIFDYVDSRLNG